MLYHTLVLPHITYGIEIWFGADDAVIGGVLVLPYLAYRGALSPRTLATTDRQSSLQHHLQ